MQHPDVDGLGQVKLALIQISLQAFLHFYEVDSPFTLYVEIASISR